MSAATAIMPCPGYDIVDLASTIHSRLPNRTASKLSSLSGRIRKAVLEPSLLKDRSIRLFVVILTGYFTDTTRSPAVLEYRPFFCHFELVEDNLVGAAEGEAKKRQEAPRNDAGQSEHSETSSRAAAHLPAPTFRVVYDMKPVIAAFIVAREAVYDMKPVTAHGIHCRSLMTSLSTFNYLKRAHAADLKTGFGFCLTQTDFTTA
ncbi:hypothetical protein B0H19DRAFT_1242188 [Mycena capillaripes]|nr:hypothetical protein B0H19DRAFT_1242188 [Mycena capillaripes]